MQMRLGNEQSEGRGTPGHALSCSKFRQHTHASVLLARALIGLPSSRILDGVSRLIFRPGLINVALGEVDLPDKWRTLVWLHAVHMQP